MQYLLVALGVFVLNVLPAMAPPTWTVIVLVTLNTDLHLAPLVLIGAIAATLGRTTLAIGFHRLRGWLPAGYVRNVTNAGSLLSAHRGRRAAAVGMFLLSPLPSAQLFEAAGLMGVRLAPLAAAFCIGRTATYSIYASGAGLAKASGWGELIKSTLTSPWGIALQVASLLLLVVLGRIDWAKHLPADSK